MLSRETWNPRQTGAPDFSWHLLVQQARVILWKKQVSITCERLGDIPLHAQCYLPLVQVSQQVQELEHVATAFTAKDLYLKEEIHLQFSNLT